MFCPKSLNIGRNSPPPYSLCLIYSYSFATSIVFSLFLFTMSLSYTLMISVLGSLLSFSRNPLLFILFLCISSHIELYLYCWVHEESMFCLGFSKNSSLRTHTLNFSRTNLCGPIHLLTIRWPGQKPTKTFSRHLMRVDGSNVHLSYDYSVNQNLLGQNSTVFS